MNKHTKVALMVAPFLIIGGYIAADYYDEAQAQKQKVFQMEPEGHCDVMNQQCVLKSGEFKINISQKQSVTEINGTFPIDNATLFVVEDQQSVQSYTLTMAKTPYYWQSETMLESRLVNSNEKQKLRVIVQIKGGQYISEFYTQTLN